MGGSSDDPNKAAMKHQKDQANRLQGIDLPELEELALRNPNLVGLLETEQLGNSAMEDISDDPRLKGMQMQALQSMQERAETGLTQEDKYAMEELLGQSAAQEQSQRAAIEQGMAERGMDNSGQALMMKLQNQQASGNRGRQQAMDMAQQARQGRESALANMSNAAGQMRGQDFAQQSSVASARDRIAAANAQNRQGVNAQNLSARQQIENQRAAMSNQNQMYNKNRSQQQFSNELAKAGAQGGVANSMSSIAGSATQGPSALQGAASGAAMGATVGGPWGAAVGGVLGAASTQMEDGGIARTQDENKKRAEQDMKSHENFKKKYMKRVHTELLGEPEQSKKEVTGVVHAEDGAMTQPMFKMNDKAFEAGPRLGMNTDMTSQEVMTNSDLDKVKATAISNPELKRVEEAAGVETRKAGESGIDGDKLAAGLGALSSMMGEGDEARPAMQMTAPQINIPENRLASLVQQQQFANPFQAEDGGTTMAQDGSLMFTSEGNGDIVEGDSFERDRVDARLNSGEAVLNVAQQQRLMDLLKGKISMDELGDEDIVEGVPSGYQEELTEEIDEPKDEKMMALMKMMGKLEG